VGDAVLDWGKAAVVIGLTANPAMVAAGSWRPSRSKKDGEDSRGLRIKLVLPQSWRLRMARVR
jgi:hypothetical protein